MGTRGDFYIGRGPDAEWIGSIEFDAYPEGIPDAVLKAESEAQFRAAVKDLIVRTEWSTLPDEGWPWPWESSSTTDYSYAFDNGVHITFFGLGWCTLAEYQENERVQNAFEERILRDEADYGDADEPPSIWDENKTCVFPTMKRRSNR